MAKEITNFNTFIAQRATGIPYSTQWMVHFDIPAIISNDLASAIADVDTEAWSIESAMGNIIQAVEATHNQLQGNALVQAVTVPGEKLDFQRIGIESDFRGGFQQTPIIKSRNDNDLLTLDFLETTTSFVDMVVRPWIILVGSRGLVPISDDPQESIKTNIWAMFFDRGDALNNKEPTIRKKYIFHNAVPVACDASSVDFQKNSIAITKTQWLYTHYTIEVPGGTKAAAKPASDGNSTTVPSASQATPGSVSNTSKPVVTSTSGATKPQPFSTLSKDPTTQSQSFGNRGVSW